MPDFTVSQKCLMPMNGVVGITSGSKMGYFLSVLRNNEHKLPIVSHVSATTMLDFVYDHHRQVIGLCYSRKENKLGHDGVATSIGLPYSFDDACSRDQFIVGGRIKCEHETLITCERSGHYGHLWTDDIRQKFIVLLNELTQLTVKHYPIKDEATKESLEKLSALGGVSFFESKMMSKNVVEDNKTTTSPDASLGKVGP